MIVFLELAVQDQLIFEIVLLETISQPQGLLLI